VSQLTKSEYQEPKEAMQSVWERRRLELFSRLDRNESDLDTSKPRVGWKVAIGAQLQQELGARWVVWIAERLQLGRPSTV